MFATDTKNVYFDLLERSEKLLLHEGNIQHEAQFAQDLFVDQIKVLKLDFDVYKKKIERETQKQKEQQQIQEEQSRSQSQTQSSLSQSSLSQSRTQTQSQQSQEPAEEDTHIIILLDIEGTIAPVPFVLHKLFPQFREHCKNFIDKNLDDDTISKWLSGQVPSYSSTASSAAAKPTSDSNINNNNNNNKESGQRQKVRSAENISDEPDEPLYLGLKQVLQKFLEHIHSQDTSNHHNDCSDENEKRKNKFGVEPYLISGKDLANKFDNIVDDLQQTTKTNTKCHNKDIFQVCSDFRKLLVGDAIALSLHDCKIPYMKKLQGLVWNTLYHSGEIQAHLFHDVGTFFSQVCDHSTIQLSQSSTTSSTNTTTNNVNATTTIKTTVTTTATTSTSHTNKFSIQIYSSGSVEAQKLLLQFSTAGNLKDKLSSSSDHVYHDPVTTKGSKRVKESYENILTKLREEIGSHNLVVLFLSDIVEELDAADAAGMFSVLCVRPCNHPIINLVDTVEEGLEKRNKDKLQMMFKYPSVFCCDQIAASISLPYNEEDAKIKQPCEIVREMKEEVIQYNNSIAEAAAAANAGVNNNNNNSSNQNLS